MLTKLTKRELIDGWQHCLDWASTRCFVIAGAIQTTYQLLPDDMKQQVPASVIYWATIATLVLGVLGRVTQPKADHVADPK